MSARTAKLVFVLLGAFHLAAGLVMLFAPGPFYDGLATFQPRNDHFVRDLATYYVALGVAFAIAARRPAWRGPVLVLAVLQYALHTANHLYDLGYPLEDWVGPVNAALVAAGLALLAVIAYAFARRRGEDASSRARVK